MPIYFIMYTKINLLYWSVAIYLYIFLDIFQQKLQNRGGSQATSVSFIYQPCASIALIINVIVSALVRLLFGLNVPSG